MKAEVATAEAMLARTELESAIGQLDQVRTRVELAWEQVAAKTKLAEEAKEQAAVEKSNTELARKAMADAKEAAVTEKRRADKFATEAANLEKRTMEFHERVKTITEEANKAVMEKANVTAQLQVVKKEADEALQNIYNAQWEQFHRGIDAAQELGEYTDVIRISREALEMTRVNPLINKKTDMLEGKIKDAVQNGGNAEILLPLKPDWAAISSDGSTGVAFFGGKPKTVTVLRNAGGLHGGQPEQFEFETTIKGSATMSVSSDGHSFCLISKTERHLWQLQGGQYVTIPLAVNEAGNVNLAWCFYSQNGQHLYLIGDDESATVEIYSVNSGALLSRQRLAGGAKINFQIKDVALLEESPNESALIVQFRYQECYEYRITWTNGVPLFVQQFANTAPRMERIDDSKYQLTSGKPQRLFVSPDGKWLALAFSEAVVVLPKKEGPVPANEFSFSVPQGTEKAAAFRYSFATLTDLEFSRDNQRIVTAQENRYLQLWDREGDTYVPCRADGLYICEPARSTLDSGFATCLRGHADAIKAVMFANGNADRLISVSADKTIRTWEVSTYPELLSRMEAISDLFEPSSGLPQ